MSATTKNRWRLSRVTIRQFRGVAGEQTYSFDGRPGLLHGHNGVGKSTLAVAIQWILYGRFPAGVLQNTVLDRFLSVSTLVEGGPITLSEGAVVAPGFWRHGSGVRRKEEGRRAA